MAVLGYFTSTTTSQVILGGIPFKTTSMSIPSYLDGFHCMDSPRDQTIRSERADIPHQMRRLYERASEYPWRCGGECSLPWALQFTSEPTVTGEMSLKLELLGATPLSRCF